MLFYFHFAATAFMTGIIWFVQLIHYPWFHDVPADRFVAYHQKYTRMMGGLVGPVMLAELASGLLLLALMPEARLVLVLSLLLLAIIWLSTFALQVPTHHRLSQGYEISLHRKLVQTNWIRTVAWTARLGLLLFAVR
ncbi:MAG: hypothetical protein ACO3ZG_04135 [Kiritimatiellia bacterium]|jgi:hypothetical protein